METNKLLSDLLMVTGCLHDVAEKAKEDTVKNQITAVQERMESICLIHFPVTMMQIKTDKNAVIASVLIVL